MRRLQTSQYLRAGQGDPARDFTVASRRLVDAPAVDGDESVFVYHALFGKGRRVSADLLARLHEYRKPQPVESICADLSDAVCEQLQQMSYLVPEGFDERALVDEALADRSARLDTGEYFGSLQLILTNGCNFACKYCFAYTFDDHVASRRAAGESIRGGTPAVPPQPRPEKSSKVMSVEVARSTVDQAIALRKATGGGDLSISLFGGEPTLNKPVILALLGHYGDGSAHDIRLHWDITTNASQLDEVLTAALARHGVKVIVSIDFLDLETQTFRVDGATAPWSLIERNVLRLCDAGVDLYVSSVLSEDTWDRWGEPLIDWLAQHGIGRLNVIIGFQGTLFQQHDPVTVANRLFEGFRYGQSKGVLLTGYWYSTYLMIVNDDRYAAQADYKTCPATGRMISIEPNGAAFTCKATGEGLGHASEFASIFRTAPYRKYAMRAYRNSDHCMGCELEGTCSGGSMGSLEEAFGDIEHMDRNYCAYMRRIIHLLLDLHHGHMRSSQASLPAIREYEIAHADSD